MYPTTGGPLLVAGFIQFSSTDVGDMSSAVSDVGAFGSMFSRGVEVDFGVATPCGEGSSLSPSAFIA